MYYKDRRARI